jgi:hypothetical protein
MTETPKARNTKFEIPNSKQCQSTNNRNSKQKVLVFEFAILNLFGA